MSVNLLELSDKPNENEKSYDIYTRLLKDRIIFLKGEVDSDPIDDIIAQMLFLEKEDSSKDIYLYIDTYGGSTLAMFALIDVMNYIDSPVSTICIGKAMSAGAAILSSGTKGKRYSLPNSFMMIHQTHNSKEYGPVMDMKITLDYTMKCNTKYFEIISNTTGKSIEQVSKDCEKDYYMTAQEALDYGLVDHILIKRSI